MKGLIKYALDKLGLIVLPKLRMDNILLAQRMQRIVMEYKIDCIFDVGANTGQYRDFLRKEVGYEGLIISFEPDPDNIKALLQKSEVDDLWVIENYALVNITGVLELNIMENSLFNSFLPTDETHTDLFKDRNIVKTKIEVSMRRFDEIYQNIKNTYGIKILFLSWTRKAMTSMSLRERVGALTPSKVCKLKYQYYQYTSICLSLTNQLIRSKRLGLK